MFAFFSLIFSRFLSDRQVFEARAFEIYLQMLSEAYPCNEYELAKSSLRCAKFFEQAIAEDSIGLEDIHGLFNQKN